MAEVDFQKVIKLIQELLLHERASWWSAPDLLGLLANLVGEASALSIADPLLRQLGQELREAQSEDVGWPTIADGFLARGWFNDYQALVEFGDNDDLLVTERVTSLQGDEIGPGNFAAQLIRSARKADAVAFLSSLDESLIDQDDFTCVVMAEVGLSTKLAEVHRLRGERSPSGCDTVAN